MVRIIRRAGFVILFWLIAVAFILGVHRTMDPLSADGASLTKILAILISAFAYVKLTARDASVQHALGVGIAWLALDIVTEVGISVRLGAGWFELIGAPDGVLTRDVLLLAWVAAPAIFASADGDARENS